MWLWWMGLLGCGLATRWSGLFIPPVGRERVNLHVLVWFSFDFVHYAAIDNVIRPKRYLPFPFFLGFLIVLFCTAPD